MRRTATESNRVGSYADSHGEVTELRGAHSPDDSVDDEPCDFGVWAPIAPTRSMSPPASDTCDGAAQIVRAPETPDPDPSDRVGPEPSGGS